ncbi:MAG: hypothetical protein JWQ78_1498 [Sediminibacterium sp.]|nr:hypothetical protein [Sediminibacterium sp.]
MVMIAGNAPELGPGDPRGQFFGGTIIGILVATDHQYRLMQAAQYFSGSSGLFFLLIGQCQLIKARSLNILYHALQCRNIFTHQCMVELKPAWPFRVGEVRSHSAQYRFTHPLIEFQ